MNPFLILAAEAEPPDSATGWVALALVIVLILLGPILLRRRKPEAPTLDQIRRREHDPRPRQSADQILVELAEVSRETSAQIDARIRVLNTLIKDAERQCRRLEKLLAESRGIDPDAVRSALDAGETPPRPAHASAPEETAAPSAPPRRASARRVTELHERIAALRDQGCDPAEIARRTRLSLQEVDLVLHLLQEREGDGHV